MLVRWVFVQLRSLSLTLRFAGTITRLRMVVSKEHGGWTLPRAITRCECLMIIHIDACSYQWTINIELSKLYVHFCVRSSLCFIRLCGCRCVPIWVASEQRRVATWSSRRVGGCSESQRVRWRWVLHIMYVMFLCRNDVSLETSDWQERRENPRDETDEWESWKKVTKS